MAAGICSCLQLDVIDNIQRDKTGLREVISSYDDMGNVRILN